jgi:HAD superfamily phosphoserine phosphatase-like hydrolase
MKKVAIFDVDGTIFRSSLLIELVDALIEEEIFPARTSREYARAYQRWLDRKDSYDKYIEGVVRSFMRHMKGVTYSDFMRVSKNVTRFHKNRVYRYTRKLVHDLKKKNYFLLAISNSPKETVEGFCRGLGFHKTYGRMYGLDSKKRFTGRFLYEELVINKANVLRRAILKEHLTLKGSVGVGDSEADIPFLKMVDHAICFNPNTKLYLHAKRAGWQVIVERKDMIYFL